MRAAGVFEFLMDDRRGRLRVAPFSAAKVVRSLARRNPDSNSSAMRGSS